MNKSNHTCRRQRGDVHTTGFQDPVLEDLEETQVDVGPAKGVVAVRGVHLLQWCKKGRNRAMRLIVQIR